MKDLLICVLVLTWVLVVIRQMGSRRYPREMADHIDRDFREMVARYNRQIDEEFLGASACWHTPHDACLDGCNCQRLTVEEADGPSAH